MAEGDDSTTETMAKAVEGSVVFLIVCPVRATSAASIAGKVRTLLLQNSHEESNESCNWNFTCFEAVGCFVGVVSLVA